MPDERTVITKTLASPCADSPFIDMDRCWQLDGTTPAHLVRGPDGAQVLAAAPSLRLTVRVLPNAPPSAGTADFLATMTLWPTAVAGGGRGDAAGRWAVRGWFMPQRVALRIYWQAVRLIAKGVRYCPHPREVDAEAYESVPARPAPRPARVPSPLPARPPAPLRLIPAQRLRTRAHTCHASLSRLQW
jgi:hypothetical protein